MAQAQSARKAQQAEQKHDSFMDRLKARLKYIVDGGFRRSIPGKQLKWLQDLPLGTRLLIMSIAANPAKLKELLVAVKLTEKTAPMLAAALKKEKFAGYLNKFYLAFGVTAPKVKTDVEELVLQHVSGEMDGKAFATALSGVLNLDGVTPRVIKKLLFPTDPGLLRTGVDIPKTLDAVKIEAAYEVLHWAGTSAFNRVSAAVAQLAEETSAESIGVIHRLVHGLIKGVKTSQLVRGPGMGLAVACIVDRALGQHIGSGWGRVVVDVFAVVAAGYGTEALFASKKVSTKTKIAIGVLLVAGTITAITTTMLDSRARHRGDVPKEEQSHPVGHGQTESQKGQPQPEQPKEGRSPDVTGNTFESK